MRKEDINRVRIPVGALSAADQNYQAYKDIEDLLKQNYQGQWVAFSEGEMVACEPSKENLLTKLRESLPLSPVFIQEIDAVGKVVDLGGNIEVVKKGK